MKTGKLIAKILVALAAVAGVVFVVATYGEQIVAWCKKLLETCKSKCKCCCDGECQCETEEAVEEVTEAVAEVVAEEVIAEDAIAEEPIVEEADFAN